MLRNIPPILSPALLKALREMGHGDTLVLADRNFPSESVGKMGGDSLVIRYDGFGIPALLDAILTLLPLDTYVPKPVSFMQVVPGDPVETPIWDEYRAIIMKRGETPGDPVEEVERFAFYEKAAAAYLIIATGETALYGNVILQKGTL